MPRSLKFSRIAAALVLALTGTLAAPLLAQNPPPSLDPNQVNGEPIEGVYVRDSAAAIEKTTLAQRMERLKEWNKAADIYQEVLAKFHDRVVPARVDADKKIYQYTSITNRVQEQLARWPQEGLDIYRARYETIADAMLEAARPDDIAALHEIYSTYFVTDAGKQAAIRLMDLYAEAGEFSAAAWIGDRLMTIHPNLGGDRPSVLYRTALASYFAGDQAQANVRLKTMQDRFPTDRGVVRGKDVLLADSLASDIKAPVSDAQSRASDAWPMFGGDPSRGRISAATGQPGARLYGIAISKLTPPPANVPNRQEIELRIKSQVAKGVTLGVMPVADRGELYFQDGRRLYAVNLESGVPLPGWAQAYPDGAYTLPGAVGAPRSQQLSVTLTDQNVLAIMGQLDHLAILNNYGLASEPRLVCLDRKTGKDKWVTLLSQTQGMSEAERSLQIAGSPLVVGDSVLVFGGAGKQAAFEDAYVICFDLNTGKHRWSTYIASASVVNTLYGLQTGQLSANTSHLAYANGRVYVQTNLGAIAALDAYNGAISWLDIYPTDRPQEVPMRGRGFGGRGGFGGPVEVPTSSPRKPYTFNPVIVRDGYVFSLPTDSRYVLIYDAGTGVLLCRIELAEIGRWWREKNAGDDSLSSLDLLIGAAGTKIYLGGEHGVICLNWKAYLPDAADPLANDAAVVWVQHLSQSIYGRPFLTAQHLFLPCVDRLMTVDVRNGKVIEGFPHDPQRWEQPEGPGNIIATADHVVIASANMVNVYTDLAVARAKLDAEVAGAPIDPQPRLRYAEVMLAAGESDLALEKLDEAIKMLGGPSAMAAGTARDRVFVDALTFAQKLSNAEQIEPLALSVKLFDRAAAAAFSPTQQVQYRLARAKADEIVQLPDAAAALYQEILSDPAMRGVPMLDENGSPRGAAALAESGIAALIKGNPAVYDPIQKAAAQAFAAAQESRDGSAGKLLAVAQTYPNSTLAPRAMLAAADAYESAASPREAVQILRQMWFKYPNGGEKARVLESMARNYLAMPNRSEPAAAALARAAILPGEPKLQRSLKLPDGTVVEQAATISSALDALRKVRGQTAAKALPEFNVPLPPPLTTEERKAGKKRPAPFLAQGQESVISNIKGLVPPLRDFTRNDRIAVWTGADQLAVYVAGQTTPLFTADLAKDEPRNCAWVGDGFFVWGSSRLLRLNADNGQVIWALELHGLPALEVARLAGDADSAARGLSDQVQIVWNKNDQPFAQVQRRRMRGGGAPGPINLFNNPVGPLRAQTAAAEQFVDVQPVADRLLVTTSTGRLLAVDLTTGRVGWQVRLTDRPMDRLLANDDFTVVKITDDVTVRIAAFDTATGEMRCSRPFSTLNGNVPINMALSADGTLVYTLPDRLCIKDLFKPWSEESDHPQITPPGTTQAPFAEATEPDQLLIAEGMILALADNGSEKYVVIYSLETGQAVPLRYRSPAGATLEVVRKLTAGKSWSATLRLVWPRLYIVAPGQVFSYNIARPEQAWSTLPDTLPLAIPQEVAIGQKHLAVIEEDSARPVQARAQPAGGLPGAASNGNGALPSAPAYMIYMFRRTGFVGGGDRESGLMDFSARIPDPAGILPAWQAVDGGFYYLAADGKLHMLRGTGE